jgi:transcriptional regulator with XRE-family HTH domain
MFGSSFDLGNVGGGSARGRPASETSALAQFLRTRRAKLQPADVGLPRRARRRVAGLRREEVAALAGVSVDYYLRIEQGRETNPSDQVLDAIAGALKLDDDAGAYLRDLVRKPECVNRVAPEDHSHAINTLIGGWPLSPAHIHDSALNMTLANPIAGAVFPGLGPEANMLRSLFLDAEPRNFFRNWDELTAWAVSRTRAYAAHNPHPALAALVGELLQESKRFRMLWYRHDVTDDSHGVMELAHPQVGELTLHFHILALGRCGHLLFVYWADAGSETERKLEQLAVKSERNIRSATQC